MRTDLIIGQETVILMEAMLKQKLVNMPFKNDMTNNNTMTKLKVTRPVCLLQNLYPALQFMSPACMGDLQVNTV